MKTATSEQVAATEGAGMLRGRLVTLRPVTRADLPFLYAWDSDPVIAALMGRRFADRTPEDWYRSVACRRSSRAWLIEAGGRPVGEVELAQINRRSGTAEIRICIGEKACWGRGLGTDAMTQILAFAFDVLRLRQIYLRVFATNERAIRLYRRLGFREEAVLLPSTRRSDPAPILLMNLTRERWSRRRTAAAVRTPVPTC